MPQVEQPIISVGQYLDSIDGKLIFSRQYVHLHLHGQNKRIRIGVRTQDGLYRTCVPDSQLGTYSLCRINLSVHAQVLRERVNHLHKCLGHISKQRMADILSRYKLSNLSIKDLELLGCCDTCHTGKIRRASRPKRNRDLPRTRCTRPRKRRSKRPAVRHHSAPRLAPHFGHTIVADSTGKQNTQTPSGKRYANVMVDVNLSLIHI